MAAPNIQEPLTHSVNIRVTAKEHKAIHNLAHKHHTSASKALRDLWNLLHLYEEHKAATNNTLREANREARRKAKSNA